MTAALAEANKDICATRSKYVMQITGDNEVGKRELRQLHRSRQRRPSRLPSPANS